MLFFLICLHNGKCFLKSNKNGQIASYVKVFCFQTVFFPFIDGPLVDPKERVKIQWQHIAIKLGKPVD